MSKQASIEVIRHSTAHIMAAAVLELFPETKLGVGPVIENGFFYDFKPKEPFTAEDLKKIQKQMYKIINRKEKFVRQEMTLENGIQYFKDSKQSFKVSLLQDLKKHGTTKVKPEESMDVPTSGKVNKVSVYKTGKFVDLCRGPHIKDSGEAGVFKLTTLAGAYWRGDEKNDQMQRIYGLVFHTQEELDAHIAMLEEAKKRDHKKLGVQLDLFTFSELVGAGLPLWTPKGTFIREKLDDFVWELRGKYGYEKVEIPHITKKDLYEKSGHWAKFQDDLFKIETREGHELVIKPMNCPHHTQIYARKQNSYRDLPVRYGNTTMVYRDEQTGELHGLSRVRSITQDDAHVFCRNTQVEEEIEKIWDIVEKFYGAFGFKLEVRLSLHNPKEMSKYLGDAKTWKSAEDQLRNIAKKKKVEVIEQIGEAAFYGPKIDFIGKDSIGREWQVATIQLDMNMPERFDLTCINEKGEKERIVMVHAAIMGSIERFVAIIIEHFAGVFPVWLSPVQVCIAPVGKDHLVSARKLKKLLSEEGFRVELNDTNETISYRVRKSEKEKIPYVLVIGDREKSFKKLTVRIRGKQDQKEMSLDDFIKRLKIEVEKRK